MAKNEAKIKFVAETGEFNDAINKANIEMSELRAELKLNETQMKATGATIEALESKHEILSNQLTVSQTKTEALTQKVNKAAEIFGESSAEVVKLQTQLLNAQAAEEKLRQAVNSCVKEIEEQKNAVVDTRTATEKLSDTIEEQENDLNTLKKHYADVVIEQGKSSKEAKNLAKQIDNLSDDLKENQYALSRAEDAADKLDNSLENVDETAEKVSDGFTVLKGTMAELAADGIEKVTEGLADITTEAFEMANGIDVAMNTFAAKTGSATERVAEFEDVMKRIYANNYGESLDDIADTMATIDQQFGSFEIGAEGMEILTTQALILRDTFEMDVNESIRAAMALVNQFGIDGELAYNLIAQGAQRGLDQNGDLLDVINEYSVHFASMGYEAEEMFNMLANGVDAGTWSVDKLGDAVKEVTIRLSDGTADEALAELGLGFEAAAVDAEELAKASLEVSNSEIALEKAKKAVNEAIKEHGKNSLEYKQALNDVADAEYALKEAQEEYNEVASATEYNLDTIKEKLASGGEAAKEAMSQIMTALMEVEDEQERYILGQSMFGTMWEDLGENAVSALMNTQGEISLTADALAEINEMKYDDLGSTLEGVKRNLQISISEPMQNEVLPAVNEFVDDVDWQGVGETVGDVFGTLVEGAFAVAEATMEAVQWMNEHKGVIVAVATVIGILTTAVTAYNVVQGVKNAMDAAQVTTLGALTKAQLANVASTVALYAPYILIVAAIAAVIAIIVLCVKHWDEIVVAVKNAMAAVQSALQVAWDWMKNLFSTLASWVDLNVIQPVVGFFTGLWTKLQEIWNGICNVVSIAFQLIGSIITAAVQIVTLPFMFVWENCKEYVFAAWEWIKEKVSVGINAVKDTMEKVMGAVKNTFSAAWNAIKNLLSPVLEGMKNAVSTAWNTIKNATSTAFNKVKSVATSAWNGIKASVSNVVNGVKNIISNVWNTIKSTTSSVFNAIKSTASNVWNGIKNAIITPIETAKNKIKGIIDTIKGFFNGLKLKFPNVSLPYFSIEPKGWKIGDLFKGSIPKLSIDWHADGGIFTKPTIFNTSSGLQGVAEAGAEAILPLERLRGYVESAVENVLNRLNLNPLVTAIEKLASRPINLYVGDTQIATATAGANDEVNGLRSSLKNRGLIL